MNLFFITTTIVLASLAQSQTLLAQHTGHTSHAHATGQAPSFDPKNPCAARFTAVAKKPICVQASWLQTPKSPGVPPEGRVGELELIFTREGEPFALDQLPGNPKVWLTMPEMDHGSMPVTLVPPAPGSATSHVLRAKDLVFSMPGVWEIRVSIPRTAKSKKPEQIALRFVAD